MDLISVIVPIYKVEAYLNRCVESIVRQTYTELEIILVDDGSPDGCPALCDEWAGKDKRIKVIHKSNGGLSDARNAGMRAAEGNYISFVDSDDWIAPEFYRLLLEAMRETGSDIAACKIQKVGKAEDIQKTLNITGKREELDTVSALRELICENKVQQVVWNKLYKKECIDSVPFEKGKCNEDEFWSYQVFGSAERTVLIDYIGYYYFQRAGSIMGTSYSRRRLDAVEAKCKRQDYLELQFPQLAPVGRRDLFFFCLYHGQMVLKQLHGVDKKEAMHFLKRTVKQHPVRSADLRGDSFAKKVWFRMAGLSFEGTCTLRNFLKIGM